MNYIFPLITRFIPFLNNNVLKLISKPNLQWLNFR